MSEHLPSPTKSRSVLLVMEDETVAHAFARILEARSHLAVTACSRIEALESLPADVIVAEFGSQSAKEADIDGLALVDAMRALGEDPVTLLIADSPDDGERERAHSMGVDEVLERPLLPDALVRAVECARPHEQLEAHEILISVEASDYAGEAAARQLLGWCLSAEVTPAARARIGTAVAEVIQNASDHGASHVELTAALGPRELRVDVVDDGPGFDAVEALTTDALDASSGFGRTHALAEEVQVRSTPGQGSRVSMAFRVSTVEFDDEARIDLSDLDFFAPATSKELLATLADDPDAPVILSPALAVVVGRLLMGPDPRRVLEAALRA